MKNILNKATAIVLMLTSMFITSCKEDAPVASFPQKQDFIKTAGETVELTFDANAAWELTLSASQFYFLEGEIRLSNWSGKAGRQTVTIHITDQVSLEEDYYCEVTMKMGGLTQIVATIKVVAEGPYFKVYPALWDAEAGTWKTGSDGYEYSSEAVETVELMFDEENLNFMLPAKVESNFVWSIALSDDAAWLDAVAEQKAGVNEVVFAAKTSAYPEGTDEKEITVQRRGVPAEAEETTLAVKIGDYRNVCALGVAQPVVFGSAGNMDDEEITPISIFAAEGIEICFATFGENGYENDVQWIDYETVQVEDPLLTGKVKEQQLKLMVRANEAGLLGDGSRRTAYLIVKTASNTEAGNFFSPDFKNLAEGVYAFAIEQDAASGVMEGPLERVKGGIEGLKGMNFELLPKSSNKWFYEDFGTEYVYRLAAAKADVAIEFEGVPSSYTYEIVSVHNGTAEKTVKTDWWVKYTAGSTLSVKLDPVSGNDWTEAENDIYAENQGGDNFDKAHLRYEGAYLLVKDGDEVVAVVDCVYDPNAVSVTDGLVDFAGSRPEGAVINMITVGDMSDKLQRAVEGSALYTAATPHKDISNDKSYPVYRVKVPKDTKSLELKVLSDPDRGYFLLEEDWISGTPMNSDGIVEPEDGVFTFTFSDSNANESIFAVMKPVQGPMLVALINIVKE